MAGAKGQGAAHAVDPTAEVGVAVAAEVAAVIGRKEADLGPSLAQEAQHALRARLEMTIKRMPNDVFAVLRPDAMVSIMC